MFTQDYLLQSVFVKGEVSNCKYHPSGHIYFTLKDPKGCVNCVMFANNRSGLSFRLQEGQQIVVCGSVDVYERDGKYQIYARQIILDGAGLLYEEYERLKKELEELGMFDNQYKQPIPKYIRKLGVVTAKSGAAVRDIIQIASRRNPYVQIVLYPAIVQGDLAAASIVNGIRALEAQAVDVIIVGRGGGSIEDLWAFNERIVAEEVFNCSIPIISAVGHETDTTIIDYVSDLRAPTPSAAAELAVTDIRDIFATLDNYKLELNMNIKRYIRFQREKLNYIEMQLKYLSPEGKLRANKDKLYFLEERLFKDMDRILNNKKYQFGIYLEKMKGLSPLEKLNSGYSYIENEKGENIRSVLQVSSKDKLILNFKDGKVGATVD